MTGQYSKRWGQRWWEAVENKRKAEKIRVEDLCEVLFITRQYYSMLRKGDRYTDRQMRLNIRKALRRMSRESEIDIYFDYLRVRFDTTDHETIRSIIKDVLYVDFDQFTDSGRGWNTYDRLFQYGNFFVCTSTKEELGTLVELKGEGCRELEVWMEAHGHTWFDVLKKIRSNQGIYRRVDIAVNDRIGILDVEELKRLCDQGQMISYCRKYSYVTSGKMEDRYQGRTLYIGSRQSDVYFCIYEKDAEQAEKYHIEPTEVEIKTRFEIRLANDRAIAAVDELLKDYETFGYDSMEGVTFGIIRHYLRFAIKDYNKPVSEWKDFPTWKIFMGDYGRERIRLATAPLPFSEKRSLDWIKKQCMPTLRGFLERDYKEGTNVILDMINTASPNDRVVKVLELEKELLGQIRVHRIRDRMIDFGEDQTASEFEMEQLTWLYEVCFPVLKAFALRDQAKGTNWIADLLNMTEVDDGTLQKLDVPLDYKKMRFKSNTSLVQKRFRSVK